MLEGFFPIVADIRKGYTTVKQLNDCHHKRVNHNIAITLLQKRSIQPRQALNYSQRRGATRSANRFRAWSYGPLMAAVINSLSATRPRSSP